MPRDLHHDRQSDGTLDCIDPRQLSVLQTSQLDLDLSGRNITHVSPASTSLGGASLIVSPCTQPMAAPFTPYAEDPHQTGRDPTFAGISQPEGRDGSSTDLAARSPVTKKTTGPQRQSRKQRAVSKFAHVNLIPRHVVSTSDVLGIFSAFATVRSTDTATLLTQLFYGIGSPQAFMGLERSLHSTKVRKQALHHPLSASQTIHALETLEATDYTSRITRRSFLINLINLRKQRIESYEVKRTKTRSCVDSERNPRAASRALDDLLREAYPDLSCNNSHFQRKRAWIENRLRRGKNYHRLAETISPNILAMIPQTEPFTISDTE